MPENEQRQQPLDRTGAHARHRLSLYQNTHRAEQMDDQGCIRHRVISRQGTAKRMSQHSLLQYFTPAHDFPAEWNTITNTLPRRWNTITNTRAGYHRAYVHRDAP